MYKIGQTFIMFHYVFSYNFKTTEKTVSSSGKIIKCIFSFELKKSFYRIEIVTVVETPNYWGPWGPWGRYLGW